MRKKFDYYDTNGYDNISDTPYKYAPKKKPSLKERIYGWVFQDEKQAPVQYASINPTTDVPERRREPSVDTNEEIRQALRDWKDSTAFFESVTEPELVDYAVFEMEAAQKRYMYLLRSARRQTDVHDISDYGNA
ncbi:YaaL family protein [Eubacteriales bacterium OttesenSCG-928-K08]|nr:YaaL family protein [Eubacteriales bacterium OttesenSCG-928-K08]